MNGQRPSRSRAGNYRLTVKNFGPIVEAAVELRPLTVFVGPSNTGKSYLAILIYALHKCFAAERPDTPRFAYPRWTLRRSAFDIEAPQAVWKALDDWASAYAPKEPLAPLPSNVTRLIRSLIERPKGLDELIASEVTRCFGIEELYDMHRRPGHSDTTVDLLMPIKGNGGESRCELHLTRKSADFRGVFHDVQVPVVTNEAPEYPLLWRIERLLTEGDQPRKRHLRILLAELAEYEFRYFLEPLFTNAHYLPAGRTGVMHAHQVVVGTLVQSATTAGLRPSTQVPRLSGVLADFLNQLIEIGSVDRRHREPLVALAETLETNVLQGAVRTGRSETGYPDFSYRPRGWLSDLPLMRASSMVSELAPVVLYLRHVVRQGDVLIIEEPESHLHPAMQTALARELARMVRAGVRVIVTTHSEWFLEALANLVRLSGLP